MYNLLLNKTLSFSIFIKLSCITDFWNKIFFQEWGSSIPHDYLGSYYLRQDMSWAQSESESSDVKSGLYLLKKVLEADNGSNYISSDAMMIDN